MKLSPAQLAALRQIVYWALPEVLTGRAQSIIGAWAPARPVARRDVTLGVLERYGLVRLGGPQRLAGGASVCLTLPGWRAACDALTEETDES